jgi:hypothetical protein
MSHVDSHGHVPFWGSSGHVVSHGHVVWRTKFVTAVVIHRSHRAIATSMFYTALQRSTVVSVDYHCLSGYGGYIAMVYSKAMALWEAMSL